MLSLIFCILFASTWVQSSRAVTTEQETTIRNFEIAIGHVRRPAGSQHSSKHLNYWNRWDNTTTKFKRICARGYTRRLPFKRLTVNSPETDKLAECAYEALEEELQKTITYFKGQVRENKELVNELQLIFDGGKTLDLLAYFEDGIWPSGRPVGVEALLTSYLKDRKNTSRASSST